MTSNEVQEMIHQALSLKDSDIDAAKALILTAKTLFPTSFEIYFTDYQLHKFTGNCRDAANCFSYIVLYFDKPEIHTEIRYLVNALKKADKCDMMKLTPEDEFYMNMFQYISNGQAGQKILLLTTDSRQFESDLTNIRIMKKFSKNFNLTLHAPRLLENIMSSILITPVESTEHLINEILPLLMSELNIELPIELANRVLVIVFNYYISKMFHPVEGRHTANEDFRDKVLDFFAWIGKVLGNWEPLQLHKSWTKDFFWHKMKQIEANKCDSLQIFYLSCFLFFISVQDYLLLTRVNIDGKDVQYILVEGMGEVETVAPLAPINHEPPFSPEAITSFMTALKVQELLQRNVRFCDDFNQLLLHLDFSKFMNRIIVDFAMYLRINANSYTLINNGKLNNLEKNVRMLSLVANAPSNPNTIKDIFECIRQILIEFPAVNGNLMDGKVMPNDRSLVFLPLTRNAIIQYVTRIIINMLKRRAFQDPTKIDDYQLGSMLVLAQLEFYDHIPLVEQIFDVIRAKGLDFPLFQAHIVNIEMIEEFMNIWSRHEVVMKLSALRSSNSSLQRRIGTRGADKSTKEDFKTIIKSQVLRSNEDILTLVTKYIDQEQLILPGSLMT